MKYKIGDFIANDETVLMQICVIIDQGTPCYGVKSFKNPDHLHWYTEAELAPYWLHTLDLKPYHALKVGDHIKVSEDYVVVLARSGTAVLLSETSNDHARQLLSLGEHFKEHVGVPMFNDETQSKLKQAVSILKAHARADDWYDVETIAMMNWQIVGDE
jgi:hypothetical protein